MPIVAVCLLHRHAYQQDETTGEPARCPHCGSVPMRVDWHDEYPALRVVPMGSPHKA